MRVPAYCRMLTPSVRGAWLLKILLVDDHVLFREGLKFLLRGLDTGLELDEAGTCAEALTRAAGRTHDLVLLDLKMPGVRGLDALAALRDAVPEIPVVVLSGEDDAETIKGAIDKGAMGFIPKASTPGVLIQALRLVLANSVYLPPAVLEASEALSPPARTAPDTGRGDANLLGITPRQLEVLRWVIQGKTNKAIARELDISDGTVKQHLSDVLKTLGAKTRTEAVYAAAKLGLRLV
jgi:DNA-binding NarL/FixJ family response regulator